MMDILDRVLMEKTTQHASLAIQTAVDHLQDAYNRIDELQSEDKRLRERIAELEAENFQLKPFMPEESGVIYLYARYESKSGRQWYELTSTGGMTKLSDEQAAALAALLREEE